MTSRSREKSASELRRCAEEQLAQRGAHSVLSDVDTQRLLHELQVHQIELEMQNDELRRAAGVEAALKEANGLNRHLEQLVAARTSELVASRDAAEAANRAKSTFLSNMSHEIRTPMNGIIGMTHVLRRSGLNASQEAYLDRVETCSRHLLELINDILDLSRIEAGKFQLEQSNFSTDGLIEDIHSIIADSATAKGLGFHVDCSGLPGFLHGDRARLSQALINYLGNAIKFTGQGSITLRGRTLEETANGYLLRFEVVDTGIGMTPEEQKSIFEVFTQADGSISRRFGGSGLGLAIAQRIARLMGGSAGVDSARGEGSTFWLTAWLSKAEHAGNVSGSRSPENAEATLKRHYRGTRILLVEDDEINQEVSQMLLQETGLDTDVAGNGLSAIQMAEQNDYALILMDMQMPEMDGLRATESIRQLPGYETTPIIAMTANAFANDREQCLASGMNDFISKPVNPQVLFATLVKWLGGVQG